MSIQESGQEPLAVVPGLVTRGRPGLRSGTSLPIVESAGPWPKRGATEAVKS